MRHLSAGCMAFALALPVVLWLALARSARAEPYIAVREGFKCSQCHVNRSGGGMRNAFGAIYAQAFLPATGGPRTDLDRPYDPARAEAATEGWPAIPRRLNDALSAGADLRAGWTDTFRGPADANEFGVHEGRLYLEASAPGDALTLYLDETLAPGAASNREAFALLRKDDWGGLYAKGGKVLPPYGLRLYDDGEFIRKTTGFNYANPDLGVELGWEPGPLSLIASFTHGTAGAGENNRSKQTSAQAVYVQRRGRVGLSGSANVSPASRRAVFGGFGGLSLGRYTLLGEYDRVEDHDRPTRDDTRQDVAFGELDVLLWRGLNLKGTVGWLNPDREVFGDSSARRRLGAEWFPRPALKLSAFYTNNDTIPQDRAGNADTALAEVHVFF